MLQQNRYVDQLHNLLEYHGWYVSEPFIPARNAETGTMELMASNFNEVDGAPAIRKRGLASAVSRMAFENNKYNRKRLTARCDLGGEEPVHLEGVVIDGWMYAEVDGKMTRFGDKDGKPVVPDPSDKPNHQQNPNKFAMKIRVVEWTPAAEQNPAAFPKQAPAYKPRLPRSATRPSATLALQFKDDRARLQKTEPPARNTDVPGSSLRLTPSTVYPGRCVRTRPEACAPIQ